MIHYNDSDYLIHYGIPGMKWGHRKARPTSGSGRLSRREYRAMKRDRNSLMKSERAAAQRKTPITGETREKRDAQRTKVNLATRKNTTNKMIQKYGKEKYSQFSKRMQSKQSRAIRATGVAIVAGLTGAALASKGVNLGSVAKKAAYSVGKAQGLRKAKKLNKFMGY